jgi:hypothetical protein
VRRIAIHGLLKQQEERLVVFDNGEVASNNCGLWRIKHDGSDISRSHDCWSNKDRNKVTR